MSRFFSEKFRTLEPYVPGEQPKDQKYVKLNTNESPFPPSEKAVKAAAAAIARLQLYSDPECTPIVNKLAEVYGFEPEEVICTNGSDEILNFAVMAYCDDDHPVVCPEISYGFYPVVENFNRIPHEEIPLNPDFSIDPKAYWGLNKTILIANPNAPTGTALSMAEVEGIVKSNPDSVVIIDEAYVDFGAESCLPLVHKYDNLLVTMTYSKSRSMAGARLGFGIANKAIIQDLNTIRNSTNPYNINSVTMAMGVAALEDEEYTRANCRTIAATRDFTVAELKKRGFEMTDSLANFVFAKNPGIDGGELYLKLKAKGVLVRHFTKPEICQYNRITIGSMDQMKVLLAAIDEIFAERGGKYENS